MVLPLFEQQTGEPIRIKMTYGEFLERFDENAHVEWADGEAIVHRPPIEPHQDVVTFLVTILRFYVDLRKLGLLLTSPFELRLSSGASREPDILFLAKEHYERRTRERWIGAADLLVEVQSESTARYDLNEKLIDYLRAGVREYWAIDPRPRIRSFRLFVLSDSGSFEQTEPDEHGLLHSTVLPGFWIDPTWLWQATLPNTVEIMAMIAPDAFRR